MNQKIETENKAWKVVELARNTMRPSSSYYINTISEKFVSLNGDRNSDDDKAVISGIALIDGISVVIVGIGKGESLKENIIRNFGMAKPEGYKKALRVMKLGEAKKMPIICLIDTPGAYCGAEAEENGEGMAIAVNLLEMSKIKVPIVSVFIGEGGSGGALALAVADKILMQENAIFSILSPEGFSSILWKDINRTKEAAEKMKLTANDLSELNVIDRIIEEPEGGAHNDRVKAAETLKSAVLEELKKLMEIDVNTLLQNRYKKFRDIGSMWR